jgi:hypothetical protein
MELSFIIKYPLVAKEIAIVKKNTKILNVLYFLTYPIEDKIKLTLFKKSNINI